MIFTLKFDKALLAAAYLLRREPAKMMNYMRLLKVLYLADRKSIRQTGRPITGDRIVAMERGPVLSGVYDLIKGEHLHSPEWAEFVRRRDFHVELVKDPGQARLSRFEIETLESVAEECRLLDEWDMVGFTHDKCEEWRRNRPTPPEKRKEIPLADLFKAVGRSDLKEIEEDAKAARAFERVFGA